MTEVTNTNIADEIQKGSYIVSPRSMRTYLIFFKDIVQKYLAKNFYVYISTSDKNKSIYKTHLSDHPHLIYVIDSFVPENLPQNQQIVYFFHLKELITKEKQTQLMTYLEANPNVNYVYCGSQSKIINIMILKFFRFYLHFQVPRSKWGWINAGPVPRNFKKTLKNKYHTQKEKATKALKPYSVSDYFLWHDNHYGNSGLGMFNTRVTKPKKSVLIAHGLALSANASQINSTIASGINYTNTPVQIKYIYTDSHLTNDDLIMPDGSVIKYSKLVAKYKDPIIEI
jgi:hypothetical protein